MADYQPSMSSWTWTMAQTLTQRYPTTYTCDIYNTAILSQLTILVVFISYILTVLFIFQVISLILI